MPAMSWGLPGIARRRLSPRVVACTTALLNMGCAHAMIDGHFKSALGQQLAD